MDNWALSAFRRRHPRALNDAFTRVLEMARDLEMGKLGRVAIDFHATGERLPRPHRDRTALAQCSTPARCDQVGRRVSNLLTRTCRAWAGYQRGSRG